MNRARRLLHIATAPVVVVGIYTWLLREAWRDVRRVVRKRRAQ